MTTGDALGGSMTPANTDPAPTCTFLPVVARPPKVAFISTIVPSPTTAPILIVAPIITTAPSSMIACSRMKAPGSIRAFVFVKSFKGIAELRRSISISTSSNLF